MSNDDLFTHETMMMNVKINSVDSHSLFFSEDLGMEPLNSGYF
jgi:hypothetical protein